MRDRRGRDRMVVGFTNTYAISAYHHQKVVSSNPVHGDVYSIQHYVIQFVSDLRQVGAPISYTNKTDRHDITEILLKAALITINQTQATDNLILTFLYGPLSSVLCTKSVTRSCKMKKDRQYNGQRKGIK